MATGNCSVHFNWFCFLTNTLGKEAMRSKPSGPRFWLQEMRLQSRNYSSRHYNKCILGVLTQGSDASVDMGMDERRDRRKPEGEAVWTLLTLLTCAPSPFYELCCTGLLLPLVYIQSSCGIHREVVPEPPRMQTSERARVTYVKWHGICYLCTLLKKKEQIYVWPISLRKDAQCYYYY